MTSLHKKERAYQPNHSPPKWLAEVQIPISSLGFIAKRRSASSATSVSGQSFILLPPHPPQKKKKYADVFSFRASWAQRDIVMLSIFFSIIISPICSSFDFFFSGAIKDVTNTFHFHFNSWMENIKEDFPSEPHWAPINMDPCLREQTTNRHCVLSFCSRFAWRLNGRLDGPWEHEKPSTWKTSSVHQGNSADT